MLEASAASRQIRVRLPPADGDPPVSAENARSRLPEQAAAPRAYHRRPLARSSDGPSPMGQARWVKPDGSSPMGQARWVKPDGSSPMGQALHAPGLPRRQPQPTAGIHIGRKCRHETRKSRKSHPPHRHNAVRWLKPRSQPPPRPSSRRSAATVGRCASTPERRPMTEAALPAPAPAVKPRAGHDGWTAPIHAEAPPDG